MTPVIARVLPDGSLEVLEPVSLHNFTSAYADVVNRKAADADAQRVAPAADASLSGNDKAYLKT